jgi:hypothetical protein
VRFGAGAMTYELVCSDEFGATLRCPDCGLMAEIKTKPGLDRSRITKAIREVRGCECAIGEGGTAAIIPGMMVYRLSDGRKMQVSDVQPRSQQIKCLDERDGITGWMDVRKFTKKPQGLGVAQAMQRIAAGVSA